MYECLPACMYMYHVCLVSSEVRRRCWIPWNWNQRQLWAAMWMLGTRPGSSRRAANVLKLRALPSPLPLWFLSFVLDNFAAFPKMLSLPNSGGYSSKESALSCPPGRGLLLALRSLCASRRSSRLLLHLLQDSHSSPSLLPCGWVWHCEEHSWESCWLYLPTSEGSGSDAGGLVPVALTFVS